MARTVSAFEAKTRFGKLLERVARGEEVVITRRDKPVARIIPEGRRSVEQVQNAVAGLNALRSQIAKRSRGRIRLTDRDVRAAIDHGRL